MAEALGQEGDRPRALSLLRQALRILGEGCLPFAGAVVLALLARFSSQPQERRAYLVRGEGQVTGETISHNLLGFHQNAIEVWLEECDWDRVEHQARALEAYTRGEPLPWVRFFVARGRALAAFGRGRRGRALARELSGLLEAGRTACLNVSARELEIALEQMTGSNS